MHLRELRLALYEIKVCSLGVQKSSGSGPASADKVFSKTSRLRSRYKSLDDFTRGPYR